MPAISPESQAHVHGDPDKATLTVLLFVPPELNSSTGMCTADGQADGNQGHIICMQSATGTKNCDKIKCGSWGPRGFSVNIIL